MATALAGGHSWRRRARPSHRHPAPGAWECGDLRPSLLPFCELFKKGVASDQPAMSFKKQVKRLLLAMSNGSGVGNWLQNAGIHVSSKGLKDFENSQLLRTWKAETRKYHAVVSNHHPNLLHFYKFQNKWYPERSVTNALDKRDERLGVDSLMQLAERVHDIPIASVEHDDSIAFLDNWQVAKSAVGTNTFRETSHSFTLVLRDFYSDILFKNADDIVELSLYTKISNCHNLAATDPAEFVRSGNDLVLRRISSPELLLQPRRCNVTFAGSVTATLLEEATLVHTIPSSAGISGKQSPRAFCAGLWAGPWIFFI